MGGVELADHLGQEHVELGTSVDVGEEPLVIGLHPVPIDTVQVRIVEVILDDAPRLVEDLLPLGTAVELHPRLSLQLDLALALSIIVRARFLRRDLGPCFHDIEILAVVVGELLSVGG